jgi:hypothetical protein
MTLHPLTRITPLNVSVTIAFSLEVFPDLSGEIMTSVNTRPLLFAILFLLFVCLDDSFDLVFSDPEATQDFLWA